MLRTIPGTSGYSSKNASQFRDPNSLSSVSDRTKKVAMSTSYETDLEDSFDLPQSFVRGSMYRTTSRLGRKITFEDAEGVFTRNVKERQTLFLKRTRNNAHRLLNESKGQNCPTDSTKRDQVKSGHSARRKERYNERAIDIPSDPVVLIQYKTTHNQTSPSTSKNPDQSPTQKLNKVGGFKRDFTRFSKRIVSNMKKFVIRK